MTTGTPASADRDAKLARLGELIASSPHNLVSRRAREELSTRHIPESVALARMLPSGPARLIDIGSGGGLPGLVLAVVRPDLEIHLLDSTAKKTSFLTSAAARLGLEVRVHTGRAEDLAAPPLVASFDIATARAVAPLTRLVGWALPYLRVDGLLYAVKGVRWERELADAEEALRRAGGRLVAGPDEAAVDDPSEATPRVVIIGRSR